MADIQQGLSDDRGAALGNPTDVSEAQLESMIRESVAQKKAEQAAGPQAVPETSEPAAPWNESADEILADLAKPESDPLSIEAGLTFEDDIASPKPAQLDKYGRTAEERAATREQFEAGKEERELILRDVRAQPKPENAELANLRAEAIIHNATDYFLENPEAPDEQVYGDLYSQLVANRQGNEEEARSDFEILLDKLGFEPEELEDEEEDAAAWQQNEADRQAIRDAAEAQHLAVEITRSRQREREIEQNLHTARRVQLESSLALWQHDWGLSNEQALELAGQVEEVFRDATGEELIAQEPEEVDRILREVGAVVEEAARVARADQIQREMLAVETADVRSGLATVSPLDGSLIPVAGRQEIADGQLDMERVRRRAAQTAKSRAKLTPEQIASVMLQKDQPTMLDGIEFTGRDGRKLTGERAIDEGTGSRQRRELEEAEHKARIRRGF